MVERARRYPKRPIAFWLVFALTGALGFGAVGALWLDASPSVSVKRH